MKPVGKPDAGDPHVRFDERGRETEPGRWLKPPRPSSTPQIVGRKRHIAVDTDGRLLMVNLTTADISDSAGAQVILEGIRKRWPWVKHLFADGAYDRLKLMDKAAYLDFVIEIIRRCDHQKGFQVLPRRWVVERTFGWMLRWRRLVRDYEKRIDVSKAMIFVAMGSNLLRRNAHP
jgi:transposase